MPIGGDKCSCIETSMGRRLSDVTSVNIFVFIGPVTHFESLKNIIFVNLVSFVNFSLVIPRQG